MKGETTAEQVSKGKIHPRVLTLGTKRRITKSGLEIRNRRCLRFMNWKKYLPIIGIVLFIYILIKLKIEVILEEISRANPLFLGIALVFVVVFLVIQTFKWYLIAYFQKIYIPFSEAFKINLIGSFYGFITPSKIGTAVRINYLKKYNADFGKGACNFTLDKILDMGSVLFIGIIFSFIFKDILSMPIHYLILAFVLLVFLTLIFIKKERSKFLLRFIFKKIVPKNIKEKAKLTFDSFYENIPKKRYLGIIFLFNVFNWVIIYFISFLIGISLGIELPFVYYLAILPIGTLVTLIPITINGLGTKEAVLISLFLLFGISATKIFSMSLIFLFFTGVVPALIGWLLSLREESL